MLFVLLPVLKESPGTDRAIVLEEYEIANVIASLSRGLTTG